MQVENWIAAHPTHELVQKMRVRCGRRWEMLWSVAMTSFTRSREDREIKIERIRRAEAGARYFRNLSPALYLSCREAPAL